MIFDTRHDRGARRALLFNTIFCLPFFNHCCTFFFPTFFSPCHLLSSSFFSLSPLVVTQIRGHVASLPPPHCGSCLAFLSREDLSPFFPRRHAPCMYLFLTKTLRDPQPSQQKNYPHTTVFIIPTAFIIPPPGRMFRARYLDSWNIAGAKKVSVGSISPRAFRRRIVRYWHPLGCRAVEFGKKRPRGV